MMLMNYIFANNDIDVWQILMYDPEAMHYQYNIMVLECERQYYIYITISPTMTRNTLISTTQHIQHIIWFNVIFYHA